MFLDKERFLEHSLVVAAFELENLFKHLVIICAAEQYITCEQLENRTRRGPHVDRKIPPVSDHHLWRFVVPSQQIRDPRDILYEEGVAEVDELELFLVLADHQVIRLHSVNRSYNRGGRPGFSSSGTAR